MTETLRLGSINDLEELLSVHNYPPPMSKPFATTTVTTESQAVGSVCCRALLSSAALEAFGEWPADTTSWTFISPQTKEPLYLLTTSTVLNVKPNDALEPRPVFLWTSSDKTLRFLGCLTFAWLVGAAWVSKDKRYVMFPRAFASETITNKLPLQFDTGRHLVKFGVLPRQLTLKSLKASHPLTDAWPEKDQEEHKTDFVLTALNALEQAWHRLRVYRTVIETLQTTRLESTPLREKIDAYETLRAVLSTRDAWSDACAAFCLIRGWKRTGAHEHNVETWTLLEHLVARVVRRLTGPDPWLARYEAHLQPGHGVAFPTLKPRYDGDERKASNEFVVEVWAKRCVLPGKLKGAKLPAGAVKKPPDSGKKKQWQTWLFSVDAWWDFVEDEFPRSMQEAFNHAALPDGTCPHLDEPLDRLFLCWTLHFEEGVSQLEEQWKWCCGQLQLLDQLFLK